MSVNIKQNGSLVKISGSSSWTGTRAEYEAVKNTIPVGSVVNITDDSDPKYVNPTVDISQEAGNLIEEKDDGIYANIPTYTLAEYESIKDTIPEGTLFNIKDDKMSTSLMCPNFLKTITIRTNLYASIQRSGNIVIISISGGPTQFVTHSKQWENLLEIPYGYRPIKDVFGNLYDPNNDLNWIMRTNNGYLQGFGQSILTNIWPFGCMAYVTADEYPTDYD